MSHIIDSENIFEVATGKDGNWIYADADCGGIALFACPACLIECSYLIIMQLVADMESLSWNGKLSTCSKPGIDVALMETGEPYYGIGLPAGVGRIVEEGKIVDCIWIANEFWKMNYYEFNDYPERIRDVILNKKHRVI